MSDGLSRSIAAIASSTRVPIVGCGAAALRAVQRASFGHPEDAGGAVLVGVLGVGAVGAVGLELGVLGLEGVADVLEEDQAQDDVLVLGGVHVVAEGVGGLPELRLEAEVRPRVALGSRGSGHGRPPAAYRPSLELSVGASEDARRTQRIGSV